MLAKIRNILAAALFFCAAGSLSASGIISSAHNFAKKIQQHNVVKPAKELKTTGIKLETPAKQSFSVFKNNQSVTKPIAHIDNKKIKFAFNILIIQSSMAVVFHNRIIGAIPKSFSNNIIFHKNNTTFNTQEILSSNLQKTINRKTVWQHAQKPSQDLWKGQGARVFNTDAHLYQNNPITHAGYGFTHHVPGFDKDQSLTAKPGAMGVYRPKTIHHRHFNRAGRLSRNLPNRLRALCKAGFPLNSVLRSFTRNSGFFPAYTMHFYS